MPPTMWLHRREAWAYHYIPEDTSRLSAIDGCLHLHGGMQSAEISQTKESTREGIHGFWMDLN